MRESNQALFNVDSILAVDEEMITLLKERALTAPHRRYRLCLHTSVDEVVQEMIVVHCRGNYSRPHAHPFASSMLILEGALSMYFFDDAGQVVRTVEMGPRGSGKPYALRIGPREWHMPVCRTPQLVFYETMPGPFDRDAVNLWSPWSPPEEDQAAVAAYLQPFG